MHVQVDRSVLPVDALENLAQKGWGVMSATSDRLLEFAHALGTPVPSRAGQQLVDTLLPTSAAAAHPRSLSAKYGRDAWPFHSDAANWGTPCRYLLLYCPTGRQQPTLLLPWEPLLSETNLSELAAAVFFIRNGAASFYTTALDRRRRFLRYDPGCMQPATPDSEAAVEHLHQILEKSSPHAHVWSGGDVLLIDNWRVLHARPRWTAPAGELKRVMVIA
jgi:hypothetical protein